jgi:hypothetical protein
MFSRLYQEYTIIITLFRNKNIQISDDGALYSAKEVF